MTKFIREHSEGEKSFDNLIREPKRENFPQEFRREKAKKTSVIKNDREKNGRIMEEENLTRTKTVMTWINDASEWVILTEFLDESVEVEIRESVHCMIMSIHKRFGLFPRQIWPGA